MLKRALILFEINGIQVYDRKRVSRPVGTGYPGVRTGGPRALRLRCRRTYKNCCRRTANTSRRRRPLWFCISLDVVCAYGMSLHLRRSARPFARRRRRVKCIITRTRRPVSPIRVFVEFSGAGTRVEGGGQRGEERAGGLKLGITIIFCSKFFSFRLFSYIRKHVYMQLVIYR